MKVFRRRAAAGEALFQGEVSENKSILPYKAISLTYQNTGQPPWVVRFLIIGGFLCNISTIAFVFHWLQASASCSYSLLIAHCQLHIVNCFTSQKKFPGAGPGHTVFCNTVCIDGDPRRGRSRRGRLGGTGLSLRGGFLQGFSLRWDSSQAGSSKVFSNGGNLISDG